MNNRATKALRSFIKKYYGSDLEEDYLFFRKKNDKVFILSKPVPDENVFGLRINDIGLYFGKFEPNAFRLSLEGCQLVKPRKHVIEITKLEQLNKWVQGLNLDLNLNKVNGYYAVKYKNDYFGTGYYKNNVLKNFVSKGRKLILKKI